MDKELVKEDVGKASPGPDRKRSSSKYKTKPRKSKARKRIERILWITLFGAFLISLIYALPHIMTRKGKFPYVKLKKTTQPVGD